MINWFIIFFFYENDENVFMRLWCNKDCRQIMEANVSKIGICIDFFF